MTDNIIDGLVNMFIRPEGAGESTEGATSASKVIDSIMIQGVYDAGDDTGGKAFGKFVGTEIAREAVFTAGTVVLQAFLANAIMKLQQNSQAQSARPSVIILEFRFARPTL
ncbi:unnamed protein product [Fusarium venenatum]|uniref:Uncharacterized protein n=1 Tax=Fusarium venenatum TaxID=56646 RepID=A0A2L2T402_9HYPO|nr:uncharacterized protein FVRRES_12680 [Fusarium venenatum]CEI39989.1 unnamed protein product [Fusarium venenatum]